MAAFFHNKKVLVTGGAGFLGKFVVAELKRRDATKITVPEYPRTDLTRLKDCKKVVKNQDLVIHLAAKVGGIGLNRAKPGELFYDNAMMGIQLMEEARKAKVEKFVTVGTVCSYPKNTPVPFKEEDLWNGYPEETNAPYGLAKKMLLVQGQTYRQQYGFNAVYLLQVNLYGPGDNFDLESSHVIPAMIRKFYEAKRRNEPTVTLWGTGKPSREFLYVEDAARGIVAATEQYDLGNPVNLGSGQEITIKKLAETISKLVGYKGKIAWDVTRPDGQPRRRLDVSKAKKLFGFVAKTPFETGLKKTIDWYVAHRNEKTGR